MKGVFDLEKINEAKAMELMKKADELTFDDIKEKIKSNIIGYELFKHSLKTNDGLEKKMFSVCVKTLLMMDAEWGMLITIFTQKVFENMLFESFMNDFKEGRLNLDD